MSEESRALVPINVVVPTKPLPEEREMEMILAIAQRAVKAPSMIPANIKNADQAFAIMLAGFELGCKPITSLRHIFVVNGKTEPDGQLMMGLVLANDPTARFIFHERSRTVADIELTRAGREPLRIKITIEEVSSLAKKPGPWQQYPADMLSWHVVKRLCRLGASDAINAIAGMEVADAAEVAQSIREAQPTAPALAEGVEPADAELVNKGDTGASVEAPTAEPQAAAAEKPPAQEAAATPPEGESEGPSPRDLFTAWLVDNGLENVVTQWLGLKAEGDDPLAAQWIEPAVAYGLTIATAYEIAHQAMQAVWEKVVELRGTPTPLQTALAEFKPLERLKAAFDKHDAAAEGKDGATLGASQ